MSTLINYFRCLDPKCKCLGINIDLNLKNMLYGHFIYITRFSEYQGHCKQVYTVSNVAITLVTYLQILPISSSQIPLISSSHISRISSPQRKAISPEGMKPCDT